jgi:hypothetical protein
LPANDLNELIAWAFEYRFDENQLVTIDQTLDLVFRCSGTEHFSGGEINMLEQLRPIEHSGDLHGREIPSANCVRQSLPQKLPQRARGSITRLPRVKFHGPEGAEISSFLEITHLRRASALVNLRIVRITLGESWRSEDGAKNDNGKKLFHGSSPG